MLFTKFPANLNLNLTLYGLHFFLICKQMYAFNLIFQVDGAAKRHQYCYWLSY